MRARKVDVNHNAIAESFEKLGWLVHRTNGDWDLTVAKSWMVMLIEVKRGPKAKATPKQVQMASHGWPIHRVESTKDVEKLHKIAIGTIWEKT